jgi:hypothetical protein
VAGERGAVTKEGIAAESEEEMLEIARKASNAADPSRD